MPDQPQPDEAAPSNTARGMPPWVKGFAIVGAILGVLIVIMLLTGHGPGRHMHGLPAPDAAQTAVRVTGQVQA